MNFEMNFARELDNRIENKEREIAQLRQSLSQAEAYLQALQDMRRILPTQAEGGEITPRLGSDIARSREILKEEGRPLHVDELLRRLGKDQNTKTSLTAALSNYVRRGQIFNRPAANTFGLLETESRNNQNGTSVPDQASLLEASAETEDQTLKSVG